jgi:hypothetical protein
MLTRSMRITRLPRAVPPGGGSRSTTRQDRRPRWRLPRSPRCRRRRRARERRRGADPTPRPVTTPAPELPARPQPARVARQQGRPATRRPPRRSSRRIPPAAAGRPEPSWPLRPRPQAAAGGVFAATLPLADLPSRPPHPVNPDLHPSIDTRGFRGSLRPFAPRPMAVPGRHRSSPSRRAVEGRLAAVAERLRGTAHPAPGAVDPGGWLAAAPSVSSTCWPYLASLASPMPLTVPSSARVAGDCAAIWRSVASWKIT